MLTLPPLIGTLVLTASGWFVAHNHAVLIGGSVSFFHAFVSTLTSIQVSSCGGGGLTPVFTRPTVVWCRPETKHDINGG